MVWMRPTQLDRSMVIWPKSGPPGTLIPTVQTWGAIFLVRCILVPRRSSGGHFMLRGSLLTHGLGAPELKKTPWVKNEPVRIWDLRGSAVFLFWSKLELGMFGIFGILLVYYWYILPIDALANDNVMTMVMVMVMNSVYWYIWNNSDIGLFIVLHRFDVYLY